MGATGDPEPDAWGWTLRLNQQVWQIQQAIGYEAWDEARRLTTALRQMVRKIDHAIETEASHDTPNFADPFEG